MGAEAFTTTSKGDTAQQAFVAAVTQAQYDHGHAGYSGTIAEKGAFVMIELPEGKTADEAEEYAERLISDGDKRIDNKWGPAGCIDLGNSEYLFFGWASS